MIQNVNEKKKDDHKHNNTNKKVQIKNKIKNIKIGF